MKTFLVLSFSILAFSGSVFADVDSAKKEANLRIEKSRQALEAVRTCVTKATTEAAVTQCRVDVFPVDSSAQRMEEAPAEDSSKKAE